MERGQSATFSRWAQNFSLEIPLSISFSNSDSASSRLNLVFSVRNSLSSLAAGEFNPGTRTNTPIDELQKPDQALR